MASTIYIDMFVTTTDDHSLFTFLYLAEGLIVLWIYRQRQQARARLASALLKREDELGKLQKVHDELVATSGEGERTANQLRESNRIMLETLDRILERQRNS
jgi:DNA repair protein RadC